MENISPSPVLHLRRQMAPLKSRFGALWTLNHLEPEMRPFTSNSLDPAVDLCRSPPARAPGPGRLVVANQGCFGQHLDDLVQILWNLNDQLSDPAREEFLWNKLHRLEDSFVCSTADVGLFLEGNHLATSTICSKNICGNTSHRSSPRKRCRGSCIPRTISCKSCGAGSSSTTRPSAGPDSKNYIRH